MLFHTKALEVFTLAYQSIQNIDEEEDLEVSCGYSIYSPCWVLDKPDFCWTSYLGAPITHQLIAHSPHPSTDLVTLIHTELKAIHAHSVLFLPLTIRF